jgi:hypothetical protein
MMEIRDIAKLLSSQIFLKNSSDASYQHYKMKITKEIALLTDSIRYEDNIKTITVCKC